MKHKWIWVLLLLAGLVGVSSAQTSRARQAWAALVAAGDVHLSGDAQGIARVRILGAELVAASESRGHWDFYVLDDPRPNAFSTGEGVVAVTEGMLALGLDDDELAGILAHEIGHGTRQHVERAYLAEEDARQVELQQAEVERRKAAALARIHRSKLDTGDAERAQEELERIRWRDRARASQWQKKTDLHKGEQRFAREFSHQQEIEADLVGLRYARLAGFRADGLWSALEKMRRAKLEGLGATHPSLLRRQQVLEKVMRP